MIKFLTEKAAAVFSAVSKFLKKKQSPLKVEKLDVSIPEQRPQESFISIETPSILQRKPNISSQKKLMVQKQTSQRKNWSKWKKRL